MHNPDFSRRRAAYAMADRKGEQPAETRDSGAPEAGRATAKAGRDARLAEALRANLHRRKRQARERAPRDGESEQDG